MHFLLGDALPPAVRPRFSQLVSLLLSEDVAAMVAAVADVVPVQLAGVLVLRGEPARSRMAVQLLAVHPDYRRLGLGRRLMARAQAAARGSGWSAVVCPEGASAEAAGFLLAMGFERTDGEGAAAPAGWRCDLTAEG